jgi:hypothetical protein
MIENKPEFLISEETFVEYVETLVNNEGFTYIEAIQEFCAQYNIDEIDIKKIIPEIMIKKITQYAIDNRLLKSKYLKEKNNIKIFFN